jgi:hypothetical protein
MMISSGQSGQSRRLSPGRGTAVCEGNAAGGAIAGRASWVGAGAGAVCEGKPGGEAVAGRATWVGAGGGAVCEGKPGGGAVAGRATWVGASCAGRLWTAGPGGWGEGGIIDAGGGGADAAARGPADGGPDRDMAAGAALSCLPKEKSSLNDETTHGICSRLEARDTPSLT